MTGTGKKPAPARGGGVTVAAFARMRGVSRQSVYDALSSGRIVREDDGSIDPKRAARMWTANTAPRADRSADGAGETGEAAADPSYLAARARREVARAELAELDAAERRGELVDAEAVARHYREQTTSARDRLLSVLPADIAPALAAESDPHRIRVLLEDAIREALAVVASEARAYAEAVDEDSDDDSDEPGAEPGGEEADDA